MPGHAHAYKEVRRRRVVKGKRITVYVFWVCQNPGCPRPNKMTITYERRGT